MVSEIVLSDDQYEICNQTIWGSSYHRKILQVLDVIPSSYFTFHPRRTEVSLETKRFIRKISVGS